MNTTSVKQTEQPTPVQAETQPAKRPPLFARGALLGLVVLSMVLAKTLLEYVFLVETADLRVALLTLFIGLSVLIVGQLIRFRFRVALPLQLGMGLVLVAGGIFVWQVLETKDETKVAHWLTLQGAGVTYTNGQIIQADNFGQSRRNWRLANWGINLLGESYFSKLDAIDLAAAEIADPDVDRLAEVRSTRRLLLSNSRLTSKGVARLPDIPGLEVITLDWKHVSPAAIAKLQLFSDLKQLRIADASGLRFLDETLDPPIELLADLDQLEILALNAEFLTAEELSVVGALPNLRHLVIWADIAGTSRTVALGLPPIQGDNPDADEVGPLVNLAKSQSLEFIQMDLAHLGLKSADVRALASIPTLRTLQLNGRQDSRFALTQAELEEIRREFPSVTFIIQPVTPSQEKSRPAYRNSVSK